MYTLKCAKESYVKILIGNGGSMINLITMQVEKVLAGVFQQNVDVFLKVFCKDNKKADSKSHANRK